MHAILDGLALGHLVKHQNGPESGVGVCGDGREVLRGAVVDGAVKGLCPELREYGGVVGVEAESQNRDAHEAASSVRGWRAAARPPSTAIFVPVMYAAWGEARKPMRSAISCGSAARPSSVVS